MKNIANKMSTEVCETLEERNMRMDEEEVKDEADNDDDEKEEV